MKTLRIKPTTFFFLVGCVSLWSSAFTLGDDVAPQGREYETREFDLGTIYFEQSPLGQDQERIPLSQLYTSVLGNLSGFTNSAGCETVRAAVERMAPGSLDENGVSF